MGSIITLTAVPQPAKPDQEKARPRNTMPDGRKRIRLDVGTDPETGKRIRKTFTGATLKECRAKRDAWLAEQAAASANADRPAPQSVAQWAETWLDVYGSSAGYSQNTTVATIVRRLIASLGGMPLRDVRQVHIQAFAQGVEGLSRSTVSKIKYTTQRVFAAALANGLIDRDPCAGVVWKHAGEGTHRFLEEWEIRLITLNHAAHHAGLWAMLMLYAGLRRGEALALRWSDIDLDTGVLHVHSGVHFEVNAPVIGAPKTANAVRDVPIFPPLAAALSSANRASEFVCTGAAGQQVTGSIWSSGWRAFNNTMTNILNGDTSAPVCPGRRSDRDAPGRKIFSVRAHDLRHTFASLLYDAGVDIKTAQKLLGHATPDITMRIYTHLSDMREAASVEKMSRHLAEMGHKWGTESQKSQ